MTTSPHTVELIRHETRLRMLQVTGVRRITPRMVRITLGGDQLEGFISGAPDDHVKLFFPLPGQDQPVLPTPGEQGLSFPEGSERPPMRNYTPRRFDAAARELDIDFVLHGDGPASTWAAQAAPGQMIGVGGPRGSSVVPNDFDWYLLLGDETALPAIGRWLEEMPAGTRVTALIEVHDANEEQTFDTRADLRLRWLHRDGAGAGHGDRLEQTVRGMELPAGDGYIWVGAESSQARSIRQHLVEERGHPREWLKAAGYWKHNAADHHSVHKD